MAKGLKGQLIEEYREMAGQIWEGAVYHPTYQDAVVILDSDASAGPVEYAFGFWQYLENDPAWFMKKIQYNKKGEAFIDCPQYGGRVYLRDFMRQPVTIPQEIFKGVPEEEWHSKSTDQIGNRAGY